MAFEAQLQIVVVVGWKRLMGDSGQLGDLEVGWRVGGNWDQFTIC